MAAVGSGWSALQKGSLSRTPKPALSVAEPPGPIDNSRIAQVKGSGHIQLKQGESPAPRPSQAALGTFMPPG